MEDRGTSVIATAISEWPSALEDVLLGTSDPGEIVARSSMASFGAP